jgi:hypothetical protein
MPMSLRTARAAAHNDSCRARPPLPVNPCLTGNGTNNSPLLERCAHVSGARCNRPALRACGAARAQAPTTAHALASGGCLCSAVCWPKRSRRAYPDTRIRRASLSPAARRLGVACASHHDAQYSRRCGHTGRQYGRRPSACLSAMRHSARGAATEVEGRAATGVHGARWADAARVAPCLRAQLGGKHVLSARTVVCALTGRCCGAAASAASSTSAS